ncbi:MAG: YjgP/YjgQ family permease, partial [Bacteroidales bacterium]|nr:YjgP/YjgQ family permease [Bacteroidales bacterium]
DIYLFKNYIGLFFMTFFVVIFIFLMQFFWKYVDDLVGKGLELSILFQLMGYMSFTFVPMALPLAILLSSLVLFGNLGERYELTAMKSAGVPLYRIMGSLILFTILCSGLGFFITNNIVPVANLKAKTLLIDIRTQKPALSIEEGVFYDEIDNYIIRIGKKEKDNQNIHDVLIYDHTKVNNYTTVTYAKKGKMFMSKDERFLIFHLYDGFVYNENFRYEENRNKKPEDISILRGNFKEQHVSFDLSSFAMQRTDEEMYKDSYDMLNVSQLDTMIDTMRHKIRLGKAAIGPHLLASFKNIFMHYDTLAPIDTALPLIHKKFTVSDSLSIHQYALQIAREHKSILEFNFMDYASQGYVLRRYEIEWHRKYALACACLLLFFIGAPLGAIIRKGGIGIPLTTSILIFVFYWALSTIGERMSRMGAITTDVGMWIASGVLLPIGIFLVYKSSKESQLLDMEMWQRKFYKLKQWRFIFKKHKK